MRMEGHARTWFTPKQKAELWERWKSGQCVADIARALERRNKSGVYRVLAGNGGIAPAPRRRALGALRLEEREEISRGIAAGRSIRRIAQGLERSPSTVSREIRRNGGCSAYRASEADKAPGGGHCAQSLVAWRAMPSYDGASRRSSCSSGRLSRSLAAEAAIPCRPRHASISRNDLSESLYPDTRRAEESADGAPAYNAADAPSQRRHHQERTGTDRRCGFHSRAAG